MDSFLRKEATFIDDSMSVEAPTQVNDTKEEAVQVESGGDRIKSNNRVPRAQKRQQRLSCCHILEPLLVFWPSRLCCALILSRNPTFFSQKK